MRYAKAISPHQLPPNITELLSAARRKSQTITFVTGVFDVLHYEHQNFLQKARQVGDVLIVGIESDRRVRELKGPDRPVDDEMTRLRNLTEWHIADAVFILPELFDYKTDYIALIETIRPDVLAVSSSTPHLKRKKQIMDLVGGEVKIVHQYNPEISTTQLLQKNK